MLRRALVVGLFGCFPVVTGSCGRCAGSEETAESRDQTPALHGPAASLQDACDLNSDLSGPCFCEGSVYRSGFCCKEGYSFSRCQTRALYVLPAGSGAKNGSDWANALDGLPPALERDTLYWLGAGNYGSHVFADRASGQAGITVRKATARAHGTSSGWKPAYADGQAAFGPLHFTSSRYNIDGGEPNGIKTLGRMGTSATVRASGSHLVFRHVEIDGGLQSRNDTQVAGGCNGSDVRGDYVVFDRCEVHNIADDGIGIHGSNHIKILHSKVHGLHGCGTDARCSGPCYNGHSDGLELSDVSDIELIGNIVYDVRSTAALFMDNWSGSQVRGLVAYNNVFYAPDSGFSVYLHHLRGAKLHNNVIWGRKQGTRYGGLAMGPGVTHLTMHNNIILNINYSHTGGSHDPDHHDLDYNLFGMIDASEYQANTNDLVADPRFANIPMSSSRADHKRSDLKVEDFVPKAREAIDTGTSRGSVPAYDIRGVERPSGAATDRGAFEGSL